MYRRIGVGIAACALVFASAGCNQEDVDLLAGGLIIGYVLGTGSETITIERNCFENGVAIECSELPDS